MGLSRGQDLRVGERVEVGQGDRGADRGEERLTQDVLLYTDIDHTECPPLSLGAAFRLVRVFVDGADRSGLFTMPAPVPVEIST